MQSTASARHRLSIRNYPGSVLFAQDGPLYKGTYDLEWSIDTNGPDPDNAGTWNSAFIPPKGANTSWLRDPIVDRTSAAAAATFDQAARKRLYQEEESAHPCNSCRRSSSTGRRRTTASSDHVTGFTPERVYRRHVERMGVEHNELTCSRKR